MSGEVDVTMIYGVHIGLIRQLNVLPNRFGQENLRQCSWGQFVFTDVQVEGVSISLYDRLQDIWWDLCEFIAS